MPRLTLTHKASQGAKTVNLPKKAPKSTTARATKPHAQAGIRRPKVAGKKKAEVRLAFDPPIFTELRVIAVCYVE